MSPPLSQQPLALWFFINHHGFMHTQISPTFCFFCYSCPVPVSPFPLRLFPSGSLFALPLGVPLGTTDICLEAEFVLSHPHMWQGVPSRQRVSGLAPGRGRHGPTSHHRGGAGSCRPALWGGEKMAAPAERSCGTREGAPDSAGMQQRYMPYRM